MQNSQPGWVTQRAEQRHGRAEINRHRAMITVCGDAGDSVSARPTLGTTSTTALSSVLAWRLIAEFLEEYRWEPAETRLALLTEEPPGTGDERWDVFLAALAEHLSARDGYAAPSWVESRSLRRFWFPFNSRAARVDAVVHAPAAFRRRGVYVPPRSWRSRKRRPSCLRITWSSGPLGGAIPPAGPHRPVRPQPRGAGRRARCAGRTPRSGRRRAGAGWRGDRRAQ